MEELIRILKGRKGGKILDFGTREGRFAKVLADSFESWDEIVGLDLNDPVKDFGDQLPPISRVRWEKYDGHTIPYANGYFDHVATGNTLHHLPTEKLAHYFAEFRRVLRPSGWLIIQECHRDYRNEAQRTQICVHHLRACIDRRRGVCHNPTFSADQIRDLVTKYGWRILDSFEKSPYREDFQDLANLDNIAAQIDQFFAPTVDFPDRERFERLKQRLKRRIFRTGYLGSPSLVLIGTAVFHQNGTKSSV